MNAAENSTVLAGIVEYHLRRAALAPNEDARAFWQQRADAFRACIGKPDDDVQRVIDGTAPPIFEPPVLPSIETITAALGEDGVLTLQIRGILGLGRPLPEDWPELAASASRIHVDLDCEGGSSYAAFRLWSELAARADTSCTIRRAISAGAIISQACKHRAIHADGQIVIHGGQCFALGGGDELRMAAAGVERADEVIGRLYACTTRQPLQTVNEWLAKDTYFTPAEALAVGLVDEVLP